MKQMDSYKYWHLFIVNLMNGIPPAKLNVVQQSVFSG